MAELAKFADERLSAILESLTPSEETAVGPRRRKLRERVALLSAFDAASLPELASDDADDIEVDLFLVEDCERVETRDGQRWSLRPEIRIETLATLEADGRLLAEEVLIDEDDVTSRMAKLHIRGDAKPLTAQNVEELQGTALASEWLSGTEVPIPTAVEAGARLAIESLIRPLRILVEDGFVGRADELARLSDYAGVLPPSKRLDGAVRRVRQMLQRSDKPPMLIYGPGGVGKSTLVAKFVLDHVDGDDADRFPFAYLSFDRAELRVEQPLTLLADAAAQLGAFFPEVSTGAAILARSARGTAGKGVASSYELRASKRSWDATSQKTGADEQILIRRYADLIADAGTHDLPYVWVLDTFEVAQRQAAPAVDRLWDFLERLQAECQRLRVIVCGRAPVEGHRTYDMPLGPLDEASALELVRMQLAELDLPDDFLLQITRAVSAQPISLRLAVLLVRSEAAQGPLTEERRREVLFRLQGNEVEGVLYRRILDHIENPDLRKLAHPGLVIRRLTPEIIREVLARPCGLCPMTEERAHELFDLLAREVGLVRKDGSGGLVQRSELRPLMLSMARAEDAKLVASLQRAAVAYFKQQDGFAARVEELYYRLAMGQATSTLDRYFDPEAFSALADYVGEFPASSQVYMANRTGVTVDPAVLAEADDLSWARQAALTARRLLDAGQADEALDLLRARSNDSVEPYVAPLEVEALAVAQRFDEAISRAEAALAWATDHGDPEMFVEVALLAARIDEDRGDFDQALVWLRQAATTGETTDDRVSRCAARVAIVRIHRRNGTSEGEEAGAVRAALIGDARELTARDLSRHPSLVRDLAAEIGEDVPRIARDALRLSGFAAKPPPRKKRRLRRDEQEAQALTSAEHGEALSEEFEADASGAVSESVTRAFQADADETSF
jgi:hypothetical protein